MTSSFTYAEPPGHLLKFLCTIEFLGPVKLKLHQPDPGSVVVEMSVGVPTYQWHELKGSYMNQGPWPCATSVVSKCQMFDGYQLDSLGESGLLHALQSMYLDIQRDVFAQSCHVAGTKPYKSSVDKPLAETKMKVAGGGTFFVPEADVLKAPFDPDY